jgi:hypothetical protein
MLKYSNSMKKPASLFLPGNLMKNARRFHYNAGPGWLRAF